MGVSCVDEVVVVTSADLLASVTDVLAAHGHGDIPVVLGGATRDASTRAALERYVDLPDQKLLIHDAVRPLISEATIAACVEALDTHEAAVAVAPVTDTLFQVSRAADEEDAVVLASIPNRDMFRRAQTPQAFRAAVLSRAFAEALTDPQFATTDDIGVVHRYLPHVAVALVAGSADNLKVTTPADLVAAEALLAQR